MADLRLALLLAALLAAATGVVLPLQPRVAPRHAPLLATATALDDFQAEKITRLERALATDDSSLDPYEAAALALAADASTADMKQRFKTLGKKLHPDVSRERDADRKFAWLTAEYRRLVDVRKEQEERAVLGSAAAAIAAVSLVLFVRNDDPLLPVLGIGLAAFVGAQMDGGSTIGGDVNAPEPEKTALAGDVDPELVKQVLREMKLDYNEKIEERLIRANKIALERFGRQGMQGDLKAR